LSKKITLQGIAQALHLSTATVSRALNNKGRVSDAVRQQVFQKARELGYISNLAGFPLTHRNKSMKIMIIYPAKDYFWTDVEIYRTNGHNLPQQIQIFEDLLLRDDINGVSFVPSDLTQLDYYVNAFFLKGVTVATFNIDAPLSKRHFFVGQNTYQSGKVAGELFLKSLKERTKGDILVLSGSKKAPSHVTRWQGLIDYVHENKVSLDVSQVYEAKDDEEAYALTIRMMELNHHLVGIFLTTALGNAGVGRAVTDVGKRDVVVIGNDISTEWSAYVEKGIIDYCLYQEPFLQGYLSLRVLADFLLFGLEPRKKIIYLPIIPLFKECYTESYVGLGEMLVEKLSLYHGLS